MKGALEFTPEQSRARLLQRIDSSRRWMEQYAADYEIDIECEKSVAAFEYPANYLKIVCSLLDKAERLAHQTDALQEAFWQWEHADALLNMVRRVLQQPALKEKESRKVGGQERGREQRSARQSKIEICQTIAEALWSEVSESRRAFSSLRYKKNLAIKVRERFRRDKHGEPPTQRWITENVIHPRKNRSS